MERYDILIVGAGAAGMGAAAAAKKAGAEKICVAEREDCTGGVLNQCIHHGFGLGYFGEDLTGTEYAGRIRAGFEGSGATLYTGTMVTEIRPDKTAVLSSCGKVRLIGFEHCILATGCREKTLASLPVSGTRPEGIFTAGAAQKRINVFHEDIGDDILILGTGDIGQIVARRLRILGKNVIAMIEQNVSPGGMARNKRECIEKYEIPVITRSTITRVFGEDGITAVMIKNLDTGEEKILSCSVLITAMGLIPERDLIYPYYLNNERPKWLSLAGNCDYVHEIVDALSAEAEETGKKAAEEVKKHE